MSTETLRASTWTLSGGGQTGGFTGSPVTGIFRPTTAALANRVGTGWAKTQTWTSSTLYVNISSLTVDSGTDEFGVSFTLSAIYVDYTFDGNNWSSLILEEDAEGLNIALGSQSFSVALPPGNISLTNFQLKFSGFRGNKIGSFGVPGSADITVTDIRIDGTYSSGTITSFSQDQAVPPVAVPYGTNVGLTASFSGASLSVSPGTWSAWVSGVKQYAGPTFTDTTWTATCGAAVATASVHIATPSVSAVTFSKNPATAGDTVTLYATISNAAAAYSTPSFYLQSTPPLWDGAFVGNSFQSIGSGTFEVRATVSGPSAYSVYGAGFLTFYDAATGSLSGPSTVTVSTVYAVTPTFTGGTAVLGTTQGASDLYTGITSGATYNRTAPATPGSQTTWMRVTNPAGDYIDRSFTTTVYGAPTCSLGASTTSPLYGASVNLTPTFTNDADNLAQIGTSQGASNISAGLASNSSVAVTPLVSTTYWARAINGAGVVADGSVTVTPQTVTMSAISPANPSYTAYGGVLGTFSTTVSGAVNTGKSWYVDNILGGNSTVGTIDASGNYTAGTQMGAHTIKAVATANGTTQVTTTVTLVLAPDAFDIYPVTTPIPYGTAASLYVEFYGGTAKVGTGSTPGAQDISANATSGAYYSTGNLTTGTDFILTVTNSLGAVATLGCHVDVLPQSKGSKKSACASSC